MPERITALLIIFSKEKTVIYPSANNVLPAHETNCFFIFYNELYSGLKALAGLTPTE
jgi:hypothetical protein